jgi:hypothetical protein
VRIRGGAVVVVLLAVVLAVGVGVAWFGAGRAVSAVPPLRAAPAIPASGVGDATVLLSADALTHPAHELVREQLQRHYDAINAKDYAGWAATVVAERSDALGEEAWLEAYDSTQDGTIRIDRIDDLPGARVLVRIRFVSIQDVADAPPDAPFRRICWRSSLPMCGAPPLIEQTGGGSSSATPC